MLRFETLRFGRNIDIVGLQGNPAGLITWLRAQFFRCTFFLSVFFLLLIFCLSRQKGKQNKKTQPRRALIRSAAVLHAVKQRFEALVYDYCCEAAVFTIHVASR